MTRRAIPNTFTLSRRFWRPSQHSRDRLRHSGLRANEETVDLARLSSPISLRQTATSASLLYSRERSGFGTRSPWPASPPCLAARRSPSAKAASRRSRRRRTSPTASRASPHASPHRAPAIRSCVIASKHAGIAMRRVRSPLPHLPRRSPNLTRARVTHFTTGAARSAARFWTTTSSPRTPRSRRPRAARRRLTGTSSRRAA